MREYKFRAWWSNTMCEVGFIDFEYRECGLKYWGDAANNWIRRTVNFEDIEFMQFTGLYDKNGKEIYEGDIVATEGQIAVVEFSKGMFCVAGDTSLYHVVSNYKVEVIGNIYDNPELLKEVENA